MSKTNLKITFDLVVTLGSMDEAEATEAIKTHMVALCKCLGWGLGKDAQPYTVDSIGVS